MFVFNSNRPPAEREALGSPPEGGVKRIRAGALGSGVQGHRLERSVFQQNFCEQPNLFCMLLHMVARVFLGEHQRRNGRTFLGPPPEAEVL